MFHDGTVWVTHVPAAHSSRSFMLIVRDTVCIKTFRCRQIDYMLLPKKTFACYELVGSAWRASPRSQRSWLPVFPVFVISIRSDFLHSCYFLLYHIQTHIDTSIVNISGETNIMDKTRECEFMSLNIFQYFCLLSKHARFHKHDLVQLWLPNTHRDVVKCVTITVFIRFERAQCVHISHIFPQKLRNDDFSPSCKSFLALYRLSLRQMVFSFTASLKLRKK